MSGFKYENPRILCLQPIENPLADALKQLDRPILYWKKVDCHLETNELFCLRPQAGN
jgi:hypothetical protein